MFDVVYEESFSSIGIVLPDVVIFLFFPCLRERREGFRVGSARV